MKYRGIVFDKDGTLLDFHATWLPIYRHAAAEFAGSDARLAARLLSNHGYLPEQDRIAGGSLLAAGNNREIAAAWAAELGLPGEIGPVARRLDEIFRDLGAARATPVDALAPTLQNLRQSGRRLGVATADSYRGILDTLRAFDVLHEFDFLAGYDSGHGVKPDAGMVLAFCAQLSLEVGSVVVVGDNRHDIEMGRNAGAGLCVGVLTGTGMADELESIADIVIDDISRLPDVL